MITTAVGLFYKSFFVRDYDRRFSDKVAGGYFEGLPFTGTTYSFYGSGWPRHIAFFRRGKRFGTEFFWNGQRQFTAIKSYKNGLPHGDWKMWYEDGKVKSLRHYVDGVIDGEYWGWHSNGQVSDFNVYDHGKELTHKSWVSDGTPFYNYVYQDGIKVGMLGGDFCKPLAKLANASSP